MVARQIRSLDGEKMALSYRELCQSTPSNGVFRKEGLKALYPAFFLEIIKTETRSGVSFVDILQKQDKIKHLEEVAHRYKRMMDPLHYWKSIYAMFELWYGSINIFRPSIAKWLIEKYKPTVAVLDPCAGWGSRCLASMSCNIPYIGCDTNINLQDGYDRIKHLAPSASVKMVWAPAETIDFTEYKYDMVLTSPPYFHLERYNNMPEYPTKKDFYYKFLIPTFLNAFNGLKTGGTMVLNFPKDFYVELSAFIGEADEILTMPIGGRMKTGHSEGIYVWKKAV